jgi:hypothetical protein
MINHVSIGTADTAKSRTFYNAALKPLGYKCLSNDESSAGYGKEQANFWVLKARRPVARRRAKVSMPFTRRHWRPVARTTASPACAPITGPTIMPPSSSIRTAIGSRLTAARRNDRQHPARRS